jgi:hypothetical protein
MCWVGLAHASISIERCCPPHPFPSSPRSCPCGNDSVARATEHRFAKGVRLWAWSIYRCVNLVRFLFDTHEASFRLRNCLLSVRFCSWYTCGSNLSTNKRKVDTFRCFFWEHVSFLFLFFLFFLFIFLFSFFVFFLLFCFFFGMFLTVYFLFLSSWF